MEKRATKIAPILMLMYALSLPIQATANPLAAGTFWAICRATQATRFGWCTITAPFASSNANCYQIWEEPDEVACENSPYYYLVAVSAFTLFAYATSKAYHHIHTKFGTNGYHRNQ